MKTLRLILGDQLTHSISSLRDFEEAADTVLMMEVIDEASYVPHHPKKIAFIFSAMRHFAEELKGKKIPVDYIKLDADESKASFTETVLVYLSQHPFDRIVVTEPGEWRVLQELRNLEKRAGLPVEIRKDDRFYCEIEEFKAWARGKKSLLMETFYRHQRKKEEILLDANGDPEGGQWNYDKENRNPLKDKNRIPKPKLFAPDEITREVLALVKEKFSKNFGDLEPFTFGVTRKQAKEALRYLIDHLLPFFGDYQDAMVQGEHTLYHSILSQYLNCGLLTAREVVDAVEKAYHEQKAPINSVEGYIRQILGWREFIRGVYWTFMPTYAERNALKANRPLPAVYWGGETKMNCMKCVVKQTREEAQSHHIQRLMVTGNFALIAGILPQEVCDWYLAVYADAYDWVELPNTLGMALYGDGGIVGTKPYAASGSYINRMSNFCKGCSYNVKEKIGENACPFNFLYWDFLMRHEKEFSKNTRMKLMMSHLKKMKAEEKTKIRTQSREFLDQLE